MMTALVWVAGAAGLLVLCALGVYVTRRWYQARTDRTFMTHDDRGFKRALHGRGVLWDPEESVVKGLSAPRIEFVALDPATGKRRTGQLLDPKTGSINLRPQYCVPLPFAAATSDAHRMIVEARVQFSLNRELLRYVYQLEDFGLALETRIQSAFRAEVGRLPDEVLRGSLREVEEKAIARLRQAEKDGDESGEPGVALGVNFHTASFTYVEAEEHFAQVAAGLVQSQMPSGEAAPAGQHGGRILTRGQGVLSLRPQQLDMLADVFKGREAASTQAILAMLEMQTRQNIAEALAGSGQLVVITAQELGLASATAQRDAMLTATSRTAPSAQIPNGAAAARPA